MSTLQAGPFTLLLDPRWPGILSCKGAGNQPIQGQVVAAQPRLYLHRCIDRATLTTDDPGVSASYLLSIADGVALYRAQVTVDDQHACAFDLSLQLTGAEAVITLGQVRESIAFRFLSLRLPRLVSADSMDRDSLALTFFQQGRLLDPAKCAPTLIDYSWHSSMARLSGAVWRPSFMVTIDVPGYEDLFINDVWQYTRVGGGRTLVSLGAELMYRQRSVEDPTVGLTLDPEPAKNTQVPPLDEPILCATSKQIRLHLIERQGARNLEWVDAARYFQSLVPAQWKPDSRYDDTLVYKITPSSFGQAHLNFEQAGDIIRKLCNLTDGMKQVCYFTFIQCQGGDSGHPRMTPIYSPLGDRAMLLRVMKEAQQHHCTVSFHANLDQADVRAPWFDPQMISRDAMGRFFNGGYWNGVQLVQISVPSCLPRLKKLAAEVVAEYGIHTTYHLDTHSGDTYRYDANPAHPHNATDFVNARIELARAFENMGINLTSECLVHPYLAYLGHVWALFNWTSIWPGEVRVPLANFVYHGAASWNSGKAGDSAAILDALIQGGGSSIEFPGSGKNWDEVLDSLYLIQPVYAALRHRKWSDYQQHAGKRRVDYDAGSFIEVDDALSQYTVVHEGQLLARDFVTVFAGPRPGTLLAYSRSDCELDWPAPQGWTDDDDLRATTLSESGPDVQVSASIRQGRLRAKLQARRPMRIQKLT